MQQARSTNKNNNDIIGEPDFTLVSTRLRKFLLCEARACDICTNPLFHAMRLFRHKWYERIACDLLKPSIHAGSDALFITGENSTTMYFITHGHGTYCRCRENIL